MATTDKKGYKPVGNQPIDNSCPSPESVLAQYLQAKNPRIPKGCPSDPFQFARFWMAHQAPADDFTEAATPMGSGKWSTPYHDRLLYTLKKFLKMKSVIQVFILEYIEKGVPWKGDDIQQYQKYCEEYDRMQNSDKEQYIDEGFKQMRKVLKGIVRHD